MFRSVLVVLCLLSGCSGESVVSQNTSVIEWDLSEDDEILAYAKIQIKTYDSEGFVEVTNGETDSLVGANKIRVWASEAIADQYRALAVGDAFAAGSTVIRVIYDEASQVKKITAVVKAAPGKNPDAGDWMFIVASPDGVVNVNDNNQWQFGALVECNFCHVNRLDTDGLFGLPTE